MQKGLKRLLVSINVIGLAAALVSAFGSGAARVGRDGDVVVVLLVCAGGTLAYWALIGLVAWTTGCQPFFMLFWPLAHI